MFDGKSYNAGDVMSWPLYKAIIAHDVARSADRSTAVVGGTAPFGGEQVGIVAAHELPQGLFGFDRANPLARIDDDYNRSSLIVADLSNDPSYAEILLHTFGHRVIGLHISRYGDGMEFELRNTRFGPIRVYKIGRTFLLEQFHTQLQSDLVRLGPSVDIRRGYEQLANLISSIRRAVPPFIAVQWASTMTLASRLRCCPGQRITPSAAVDGGRREHAPPATAPRPQLWLVVFHLSQASTPDTPRPNSPCASSLARRGMDRDDPCHPRSQGDVNVTYGK